MNERERTKAYESYSTCGCLLKKNKFAVAVHPYTIAKLNPTLKADAEV